MHKHDGIDPENTAGHIEAAGAKLFGSELAEGTIAKALREFPQGLRFFLGRSAGCRFL